MKPAPKILQAFQPGDAQPTTLYITQGIFGIMSTVELRGETLYFSAASDSEA
jgi:hypothetical protein